MSNLETNLAEMGIDLASFPLVLQYNKRDLPEAVAVEELRKQLNRFHAPEFETVASRGEGILPALREITRIVVKDLKSRQPHRPPSRAKLSVEPARAPAADAAAPSRSPPPSATPAAAAPATPGATQVGPPRSAPLIGLSFARLFADKGGRVAELELLVRERSYGLAVRRAAEAVNAVLSGLPGTEQGPAARALLLGLDGREYLRLARLAAQPEATVTERDALFALYVLVSAMVKADSV
jgi:hypothetical protein